MEKRFMFANEVETLVATFGAAQLVETPSGRFELRGGTLTNYQEAKEWCSLFMPEAVIWRTATRATRLAA